MKLFEFWERVVVNSTGCWEWTGPKNHYGYGQFHCEEYVTRAAHRISYEMERGPLPKGLLVCHACDNRACVRPEHLFVGTPAQNSADMVRKGRYPRGMAHGSTRYTDADVREVLRLRSEGLLQKEIAAVIGCSQAHVSRLLRGEGRRDITQNGVPA